MATKLDNFSLDARDWYQHWFDETGIDFEENLLELRDFNRAHLIFPLFLFHVEMICSIVPRKEAITMRTELEDAQASFNILTVESKSESLDANPQLISEIANHLKRQMRGYGKSAIQPILWSYLKFWMATRRKEVFLDAKSEKSANTFKKVKELFNNIYYYSYSSQHQMYKRRLYFARRQMYNSFRTLTT
ncbi:hypothetical protein PtA15_4A500 [Puccinia triticina]|uniref:Uncharacterized protein n=1 Tax=Puccinia triticina TaxID=208348 RepID=A0ABY7CG21_9BASI|nr:uncharacterized protein PtA15_4A500 [Puccinia triticina]WAQ84049.1 hypothetical protein PtA15_4A500 [Puccinia triticina]WAR54888.1 hypothetical protein PtB15_4B506 [Puccinia triticina]